VTKIEELRDRRQLPFPDLLAKIISSLKGSIDFPQPESVCRTGKDSPIKLSLLKNQSLKAKPAKCLSHA